MHAVDVASSQVDPTGHRMMTRPENEEVHVQVFAGRPKDQFKAFSDEDCLKRPPGVHILQYFTHRIPARPECQQHT